MPVSIRSAISVGIGAGLLSYTVMTAVTYLVELIAAKVKNTEKPKWSISVVTIIVSFLFLVYFFVPASLF